VEVKIHFVLIKTPDEL